ncbi:MAG: hypothetical protein IFJ96_00795 [Acidobacteria bacterium]|nr:hypothetical protein [Candidatus Sulfomarinibacter sp. MAG AM2]
MSWWNTCLIVAFITWLALQLLVPMWHAAHGRDSRMPVGPRGQLTAVLLYCALHLLGQYLK